MLALLGFLKYLIGLYMWIVIAAVVMSWLVGFNVINPYNQFVRMVLQALSALTDPILRPLRRLLPDLGGLDLSPVLLILALIFLNDVLIGDCSLGRGRGFIAPLFCGG